MILTRTNAHNSYPILVSYSSVWGILIVLANREETEGAFTQLNIGQWKLVPILDVSALSKKTLHEFSRIFDKFRNAEFRNIDEQFSEDIVNVDKNRLGLDIALLKALDPSVNETVVKDDLLKLYGRIYESLRSWIKRDVGKVKND